MKIALHACVRVYTTAYTHSITPTPTPCNRKALDFGMRKRLNTPMVEICRICFAFRLNYGAERGVLRGWRKHQQVKQKKGAGGRSGKKRKNHLCSNRSNGTQPSLKPGLKLAWTAHMGAGALRHDAKRVCVHYRSARQTHTPTALAGRK